MIKIKLYELEKHRNECTFRPFIFAQNILREIGIEFTNGDSYDFTWIAQASFTNKKVSLDQSVNEGLEFLAKINGDYMLIDGQDSASLIGTYEVFKQSNAICLLKNSLYKNRDLYKQGWNCGRYYWGMGEYKLNDFDKYSDRIMLSGTNWIATHYAGIQKQFYDYRRYKEYDISAMFQYPSAKTYEYNFLQSIFYDEFRKKGIDIINKLNYKIAKLENGNRVSIEEYYNKMFNSKIVFAPFGYGEMAPRDLEAILFGAVLIKPDISHIETLPNIFEDGQTYISCKHDFSDLEEKINLILDNYENYFYIIENSRKKILTLNNPEYLAIHLHNVFKSIPSISTI